MQNIIVKVSWYLLVEGYGEFEEAHYDFETGAHEDAFFFRLGFPVSSKYRPDQTSDGAYVVCVSEVYRN